MNAFPSVSPVRSTPFAAIRRPSTHQLHGHQGNAVSIYPQQHIRSRARYATAADDVLTITQQSYGAVFDMGAGNDTVNFGAQANGATVVNAETVNGSAGNDFIRRRRACPGSRGF